MTQYNTLNVKLSNSQPSHLKSGIEKGAELTLNLSSNVIGDSTDETNIPHRTLLTDTQVPRMCKGSVDNWLANIKISKTQLVKMVKLGEILSFVL